MTNLTFEPKLLQAALHSVGQPTQIDPQTYQNIFQKAQKDQQLILLHHKSCPNTTLDWLLEQNPNSTVTTAAANTLTLTEKQATMLAKHYLPQLRKAATKQQNCPKDTLAKLAQSPDGVDRHNVAESNYTDKQTLAKLAHDPVHDIAGEAIANKNCPTVTLIDIYVKTGKKHDYHLTKNPACPPEILTQIATNTTTESILANIVQNPTCPENLRETLRQKDPRLHNQLIAKSSRNPKVLAKLAGQNTTALNHTLAQNPAIDQQTQTYLFYQTENNPNTIRHLLAANPNITAKTQQLLEQTQHHVTLNALTQNNNCDPQLLKQIATKVLANDPHYNKNLLENIAANNNCDTHLLQTILTQKLQENENILVAALLNKQLWVYATQKICQHPNQDLQTAALLHLLANPPALENENKLILWATAIKQLDKNLTDENQKNINQQIHQTAEHYLQSHPITVAGTITIQKLTGVWLDTAKTQSRPNTTQTTVKKPTKLLIKSDTQKQNKANTTGKAQ